jgi:hypothetical protein
MRRRKADCLLVMLLLGFGAVGCGKREVVNNGPDGMYNLQSIAKAYTVTAIRVGPPTRVEDIMPVLKEIGDPQELLRSPRDGKPHIIVWGIDVGHPMTGRSSMPILAYEQVGKDGKRQAIDLTKKVTEYTAEEFARLKLPVPPNPTQ